jgi:hypothetical protein
MKTIEITYEWVTAGNAWGKGYGKARTLETAWKRARACAMKLAREAGCPDSPPDWRVYKRTITREITEQVEVVA